MNSKSPLVIAILVAVVATLTFVTLRPTPQKASKARSSSAAARSFLNEPVPTHPLPQEPITPYERLSDTGEMALRPGANLRPFLNALLRLTRPRYSDSDVEKVLVPLLNHPNPEVRTEVAVVLIGRGSQFGRQTLLDIVAAAKNGYSIPPNSLKVAVSTLVKYRFEIPVESIVGLMARFPGREGYFYRTELIVYPLDELLPWWEEPIRKRVNTLSDFDYFETYRRASPDIVARLYEQRAGSATRPANRFMAEYDLYLVGENPTFFPEIIEMAEMSLGRRPVPPAPDFTWEIPSDVGTAAWWHVLYSSEPAALNLLRSVASEPRTKDNNYRCIQALSALFYLHRDYATVDHVLLKRLDAWLESIRKDVPLPGLLDEKEKRIMSVRGNPLFAQRMLEQRETYDTFFIRNRNVPIEHWIDLPRPVHPAARVAVKGEP